MTERSSVVKSINKDIWKIRADSNIYILDLKEKIAIDAGNRAFHQEVSSFLPRITDPEKIRIVILTHLHYDHIGNLDLFPNAKVFCSKEAKDSFEEDPSGTVLDDSMLHMLKDKLHPITDIEQELDKLGLKIIPTPGHTKGSICLWYEKERILFSGDTLFDRRILGRTDLKTSVPEKMQGSIITLLDYNFKILCPGHDY